jgi:hypothetical protein
LRARTTYGRKNKNIPGFGHLESKHPVGEACVKVDGSVSKTGSLWFGKSNEKGRRFHSFKCSRRLQAISQQGVQAILVHIIGKLRRIGNAGDNSKRVGLYFREQGGCGARKIRPYLSDDLGLTKETLT